MLTQLSILSFNSVKKRFSGLEKISLFSEVFNKKGMKVGIVCRIFGSKRTGENLKTANQEF